MLWWTLILHLDPLLGRACDSQKHCWWLYSSVCQHCRSVMWYDQIYDLERLFWLLLKGMDQIKYSNFFFSCVADNSRTLSELQYQALGVICITWGLQISNCRISSTLSGSSGRTVVGFREKFSITWLLNIFPGLEEQPLYVIYSDGCNSMGWGVRARGEYPSHIGGPGSRKGGMLAFFWYFPFSFSPVPQPLGLLPFTFSRCLSSLFRCTSLEIQRYPQQLHFPLLR